MKNTLVLITASLIATLCFGANAATKTFKGNMPGRACSAQYGSSNTITGGYGANNGITYKGSVTCPVPINTTDGTYTIPTFVVTQKTGSIAISTCYLSSANSNATSGMLLQLNSEYESSDGYSQASILWSDDDFETTLWFQSMVLVCTNSSSSSASITNYRYIYEYEE